MITATTLQFLTQTIVIPEALPRLLRRLPRAEAAALTLFSKDPEVSYLISRVALEELNGRDAYLYTESVRVAAAIVLQFGLATAEQKPLIEAVLSHTREEDCEVYGD